VRHLARIVESLTERTSEATSDDLVAQASVALGPSIVARAAPAGRLSVISLDQAAGPLSVANSFDAHSNAFSTHSGMTSQCSPTPSCRIISTCHQLGS
jgi:hypothetical protein